MVYSCSVHHRVMCRSSLLPRTRQSRRQIRRRYSFNRVAGIDCAVTATSAANPEDREELIQLGFMFAKSQGLLQVPTIVYIAALNILEVGYTALAKAVTNFESYELIREHENVLFLRQMLYKLLCKNVSYFYLAFYKSEFEELLKALLLINVVEMAVTVLKQIVVQGLYRYKLQRRVSREGQMKKDENQTHAGKSPILEEMELAEGSAADVLDYSRITAQFGKELESTRSIRSRSTLWSGWSISWQLFSGLY
mmetsp:Transcript_4346/g.18491  ORF Transcript_4346/g.18491 Transcript_4346/m.18491 type:complete len:252 (+) Transcript_4346:1200-1955(+)